MTTTWLQYVTGKTFAEFFAGIGLVRLALERQGWSCAWANDLDPRKYAMYQDQFPDASSHFVLGDIAGLDPTSIPTVTLATASFPCQDLSRAGMLQGFNGERSSLVIHFTSILERMRQRPPLVVLENVASLLEARKGEDFLVTLQLLNGLGYAVDALLLDAARFVPQSRQRLFIVGLLEEVFPEAGGSPPPVDDSPLRPPALAAFIERSTATIRWRIRPLPSPPTHAPLLEAVVEDLPKDDPAWWSQQRVAQLLEQMRPPHRASAERMMRGERWTYGTVFRRTRAGVVAAELRTDGIAGCLRTAVGGSSKQILVKAGYGHCLARFITAREAARLMGADDYRITVPENQALTGFGDAVCVPAFEWLARHYLHPVLDERLVAGTAHGRKASIQPLGTPGGGQMGEERSAPMRLDLDRPLTGELAAEIAALPPATAAVALLCHLLSDRMRAPAQHVPYAGARLDLHDIERLSINALHRTYAAPDLLGWIRGTEVPEEAIDGAIQSICPPGSKHLADIHVELQKGNPFPLPPGFSRGKSQSRFPYAEAVALLYDHWRRCLRQYEDLLRLTLPQDAQLSGPALALYGYMLRMYVRRGSLFAGRVDPPRAMLDLGWWIPHATAVAYFEELYQHRLIQPSSSSPQGVEHVYELPCATRALLIETLDLPRTSWGTLGEAKGSKERGVRNDRPETTA